MSSLAVVILTHNEAIHLDRCLTALEGLASQVFIIDSGSTDRTVEIAKARGATVLSNRWTNYARQFQWALDTAPISADWVMRLDADEVIEPDLAAEIARRLPALPSEVTGVNLKRKHVFMGRWIRHGGRYPLVLLRIWRRGKARIEQRWMDEHMLLTEGRAVTFDGGFADVNLNDLTFFTDKHNKYATREAVDVLARKLDLFSLDNLNDTSDFQTKSRRFIKENIYNSTGVVGSLLYFLYRMIFQLGFLDGREGFIYHFLQGFWYRFLVAAKVAELEGAVRGLSGRQAILAELGRRTGLKLDAGAS